MLEDNVLLSYLTNIFRLELPYQETMEEYLDYILPKVRSLGKSLNSTDVFTKGKYWLEISDADDAHESILHMFDPEESEGESTYMYSIDGNMMNGSWTRMGGGTILIKGLKHEMYELVFLNADFFIIRKHGNHQGPKYLFLASENKISRQYEWYDALGRRRDHVKLEWRDIMELLFDSYRYNIIFIRSVVMVIAVVFLFAVFSI